MARKKKLILRSRKLTREERKELCETAMKRVMPILIQLEEWRASSLNSPFRF